MPLHHTLIDETFRSAWWRFLRLWKPMAGWTLITYLLAVLILVPLLSAVLGMVVFRGERVIVGNEDLVRWLLHPVGIGYLATLGGLAIMSGVIRYAGLFRILVDDIDQRRVSMKDTFFELLPDVPALLRLCITAVAAVAVLVAPLILLVAGIYALFLGEHDINYYLFESPPEWRQALWATGIVFIVWVIPTGYVALRSLPALPAFLDGHRPLRSAVAESWRRTRGEARRALWLLALSVAAWLIVRVALHGLYAIIAAPAWRLLDLAVDSLTPLLLATTVWAAGTLVLDVIISFVGFSLAATVLTKYYFEDTDLHEVAPSIPLGLRALPRNVARMLLRWLRPQRSIPVTSAIVILSIGASGLLLRPVQDPPDFAIVAHRAGAFLAVENTLEALERSIEAGANYAEIDLQRTRDGEVVVVHDADMMRLAGDRRSIATTDAADLLAIPLMAPDGAPPDERRLATLDEFLERSRGRIQLMLELKYYGFDPELAPAVIERVRAHGMEEEVLIISLSVRAVEQVRAISPDLRTGYLATVAAGDLTRLPVQMLGVARPIASASFIRSARRQNIEVHVWTLNTVATMLAAVDRGADGIITDDPVVAAALRNELASLTPPERLILRMRNLLPDIDMYLQTADAESPGRM